MSSSASKKRKFQKDNRESASRDSVVTTSADTDSNFKSKTKISIGQEIWRWCKLKSDRNLKSHCEVAKLLLDIYEVHTKKRIFPDLSEDDSDSSSVEDGSDDAQPPTATISKTPSEEASSSTGHNQIVQVKIETVDIHQEADPHIITELATARTSHIPLIVKTEYADPEQTFSEHGKIQVPGIPEACFPNKEEPPSEQDIKLQVPSNQTYALAPESFDSAIHIEHAVEEESENEAEVHDTQKMEVNAAMETAKNQSKSRSSRVKSSDTTHERAQTKADTEGRNDGNRKKRFVLPSREDIQQAHHSAESDYSISSLRSNAMVLNTLKDFSRQIGISDDIFNLSKSELNDFLEKFYVGARTKTGDLYKTNSYMALRFGIARVIKLKSGIDVIHDPAFATANKAYKGQKKELKRKGKGGTEHIREVSAEDLTKLYCALCKEINTPKGLQRKVWLDIMLYLDPRNRLSLRLMKKDSIKVGITASGQKYLYAADSSSSHAESSTKGRTYEQPGYISCPVSSFEKYMSRLHPESELLWQRAKSTVSPYDAHWYAPLGIGEKTLAKFMSQMSEEYELSERYTNHSLTKTVVRLPDNQVVLATKRK